MSQNRTNSGSRQGVTAFVHTLKSMKDLSLKKRSKAQFLNSFGDEFYKDYPDATTTEINNAFDNNIQWGKGQQLGRTPTELMQTANIADAIKGFEERQANIAKSKILPPTSPKETPAAYPVAPAPVPAKGAPKAPPPPPPPPPAKGAPKAAPAPVPAKGAPKAAPAPPQQALQHNYTPAQAAALVAMDIRDESYYPEKAKVPKLTKISKIVDTTPKPAHIKQEAVNKMAGANEVLKKLDHQVQQHKVSLNYNKPTDLTDVLKKLGY